MVAIRVALAEHYRLALAEGRIEGAVGLRSGALLALSESTLSSISEVADAWEKGRTKIIQSEESKARDRLG